jgi:putative intracellular protease/amidase
MDTPLFPPTLRIGILVFDGFEPVDVWGFAEAFTISRFVGTSYYDPRPYPFEVLLIANAPRPCQELERPAPVKSWNGPRVAPDCFRDDAFDLAINVLMIPGGGGVRSLLDPSCPEAVATLLEWVQAMNEKVGIMSSVCTGAAVLAAAGVLDGKPAATNHQAFGWVSKYGPRVLWDNVARWVDAGHCVTSAGVSAGTDLGFYLVKRLAGRAVAEAAALAAEYDWHRNPEEPIRYPQQAEVPSSR